MSGLNIKIALFAFANFILKYVNVSTSNLNAPRFRRQFERRQRTPAPRRNNRRPRAFAWPTLLLKHPLGLLKLVANYHDCHPFSLAIVVLHLLLLLHYLIKSIVYIYLADSLDAQMEEYLVGVYYSHPLSNVSPVKMIINYQLLSLVLYVLLVRLLFVGRLLGESCANRRGYARVRPSQLTLGYLTLYKARLLDYPKLLRLTYGHRGRVAADGRLWRAHYSPNLAIKRYDLDRLALLDQKYYLNLVDMECECLGELAHYFWLDKRQPALFCNWFSAQPAHRCGADEIALVLALVAACIVLAWVLYWAAALTATHLELANAHRSYLAAATTTTTTNGSQLEPLGVEFVVHVWLSAPNVVKLFESYFFFVVMVPVHFDAFLLFMTILSLYSRVKKLKNMLVYELTAISRAGCPLASLELKDLANLNQRLQYCVRLIGLLCHEMQDLKREWWAYLNLVFVCNLLVVSFVVSLSVSQQLSGPILVICSANSCVPVAISLISGAIIERAFRQLYFALNSLLADRFGLIQVETAKMMNKVILHLEVAEKRSLVIGGFFVLDWGSLGELFAVTATIVLLLERFVRPT